MSSRTGEELLFSIVFQAAESRSPAYGDMPIVNLRFAECERGTPAMVAMFRPSMPAKRKVGFASP